MLVTKLSFQISCKSRVASQLAVVLEKFANLAQPAELVIVRLGGITFFSSFV